MFFDRLAKFAALIAMLGCVYLAITALGKINLNGSGAGITADAFSALAAFGECILWGLTAAVLLVAAFLRDFTDTIVDQLLMPHQRLKAPPPMLSSVRGLLESGNFQEAEHRLEEVLAETPECPLAWKLAFDMRLEYQHDPSGAMLVAEQYFRLPKREYAPENRQMLLVYAELAGAAGQEQAARSLIQSELKNHRRSYSAGDRRLLRQRLVVS